MNQAVAATNPDLFQGAEGLLKYGPLGLAALLLVLVVFTLVMSNIDPVRERLLRLFLYVGAFCFVVAAILAFLPGYVGAGHMLYLRIEPIEMAKNKLPPPTVIINGKKLDQPFSYLISSTVTAIIDVGDSIDMVDAFRARDDSQKQKLNQLAAQTKQSIDQLVQLNNIQTGNICYGGAHGVPSPDAGAMVHITSAVSNSLGGAMATLQSLAEQPAPEPSEFKKAAESHATP
jgi:hypothetical protein